MDTNKNLASFFGVNKEHDIVDAEVKKAETIILPQIPENPIVKSVENKFKETEKYKKATETLAELADLAVANAKHQLQQAQEMENIRMYETASESLRAAKEIVSELATIELNKQKVENDVNKHSGESSDNTTNIQNNIVFQGSITDVLDQFRPERALKK